MAVRPHHIAALAAAIERARALDAPADAKLRAFFRANPSMGQNDRAFVAEGTFAFLRRMRSLTALAQTDRAAQARARDRSCATSAIRCASSSRSCAQRSRLGLRNSSRAWPHRLRRPSRLIFPTGSGNGSARSYGVARRETLARALLVPAPFDLRVNVLKATRDEALAALAAEGLAVTPTPFAPFGLRVARPPATREACVARRRARRSAGRGKPARRAPGRAQAQRPGRRFLRGCGRQDACARRADALAGASLRIRRRRQAPGEHEAAACALRPFERASGSDRARARHADQAARGQGRSRARRRAVHGVRHAAPQPRSQVAARRSCAGRARAQAGRRSWTPRQRS